MMRKKDGISSLLSTGNQPTVNSRPLNYALLTVRDQLSAVVIRYVDYAAM